jgi:hypothetical protein
MAATDARSAPRRGENRLEAIRVKSGVLAPPGAWLDNMDCMERCQSGRQNCWEQF